MDHNQRIHANETNRVRPIVEADDLAREMSWESSVIIREGLGPNMDATIEEESPGLRDENDKKYARAAT